MSITITPKAAEQLLKVMEEQKLLPQRTYLRVTYNPRAQQQQRCCIELKEHDGQDSPMDQILESSGVQVRCDDKSYHYVQGISIDYHDGEGAHGFTITRPPSQWPAEEPYAAPWIQEALQTVMDPEIGVNIVDLGLIYGTSIAGSTVTVTMTMTTPACPMTEMIVLDVKSSLLRAGHQITAVAVDVVWEPPWVPDMISSAARKRMGW